MLKKIFIILGILLVGAVIVHLVRVEVTNTVWKKSAVLNINAGEMSYYPIRFVIPRAIEFIISTKNSREVNFIILTEKQFEISMKSGQLPEANNLIYMRRFSGKFREIVGPLKAGKYYSVIGNPYADSSLVVTITTRLLNKYDK